MHDFPHHYTVVATGRPDGDISLAGTGLNAISSAPPLEFGGPGDRWAPETLLVASVADCFVLSFRAITVASKFSWDSLKCEAEGTLSRNEGKTRFTDFVIHATLEVHQDSDVGKAHRLLEKTEKICLITNSLSGKKHLDAVVSKASRGDN